MSCPDCQSKDRLILTLADRLAMCSEILGKMAVKRPEFADRLLEVKQRAEGHVLLVDWEQHQVAGNHV